MDRIRIRGGNALKGEIRISGAKNAALPLMCTCLLTDDEVRLDNVPDLADITTMTNLLAHLGVEVTTRQSLKDRSVIFSAKGLTETTAPYDLVRKMRASVLVLGPLVARHGQAKVSLPGGCAIGTRPVDLHIKGLQQMGAEIELDSGYIIAKAPGGLRGGEVTFPKVSVGATEN
jgi:UDP-N-acetylglucosamine 1-carboxyvinyltransferase